MQRIRGHLTYANVTATLALICAVAGGTSAIAVKKNPKGATVRVTKKSDITKTGKIRPGRVARNKIATGAIGANQLGTILVRQLDGEGAISCQAGERRIAGGAFASLGLIQSVPESAPQPESWRGSGGGFVRVQVLCLAP